MDEQPEPIQADAEPKKSSGYRRLRFRHRALIEQHEALQAEHQELQAEHAAMEAEIERAAREAFSRLAQAPQKPWFETADQILAQVEINPDRRAIQTFVAALASLQQRASDAIVMRMPA
jgi:vacuolar-type H+-ATPase subunit D/Vma8